jgi:hypothetical protein
VGVLIRWQFRLIVFQMIVGFWRLDRRRLTSRRSDRGACQPMKLMAATIKSYSCIVRVC